METNYHITDKEFEEISIKSRILKQYDEEFLKAREDWKNNGGLYPNDKGKDLRRELAIYGISKSEILKELVARPGVDPGEVQRFLSVIKISGVDMYGADHYEAALKIVGEKKNDTMPKIPEQMRSDLKEIALRDLFQRLKQNNFLGGEENTFVYIFGGRKEIPESNKFVEVKIKNVDLIRLVLLVKKSVNTVKWPILQTYCRRNGKTLKLYHSVLNQAETSDSDVSCEIAQIVEDIKNKYGY